MFNIINFQTPSIIFGMDTLNQVGIEAKKLGAKKVLFVTGPNVQKNGFVEKVESLLEKESIEVKVVMPSRNTPEPTTDIPEVLKDIAKEMGADLVIGMGGGSVLDVAKMTAALMNNPLTVREYFGKEKVPNKGLPTILIPSTSGTGSEVTKHAIFLDEKANVKKAVASSNILPTVAIIDPLTTITCPQKVTAASGFDAFLHAAEPFISKSANPLTDVIALEAISMITKWIGPAYADGENTEARYYMSLGSLLAGLVLNNSGTSLVHALAYPIGGEYHVPHGPSLTCLVNPEKFTQIAKAMGENVEGLSNREGAKLALDAINEVLLRLNLPRSLTDLNITDKSKVDKWAIDGHSEQRLLSRSARKLSVEDIKKIYLNAF